MSSVHGFKYNMKQLKVTIFTFGNGVVDHIVQETNTDTLQGEENTIFLRKFSEKACYIIGSPGQFYLNKILLQMN